MNQETLFNRLVENAFDFLSKAISEFQEHPKYSVIHFHAAVELFVKARLMKEHWTLLVAKRQDPDWDKFIVGDFVSVTLGDAAVRLSKVVRSGLSKNELEAFISVTKHRNKMVHFFHEAHSSDESEGIKQGIAKQQLKAWFFLHRLISVKWENVFSDWSEQINKIDKDLRKEYEFLQVVFDNMKSEIDFLKNNGFNFECCPSCEFESQKHLDELDVIYDANCLVCGYIEKCLDIECPDCDGIVYFEGEGFSICSNCKKQFEPEDVADLLVDDVAVHISVKDGDDSLLPGNCSECDGYHTLVITKENLWVCAGCFGKHETVQCCGWCNEANTGDMENSYWSGCNVCEGSAGWERDKND